MAPRAGFEPATARLTAVCSTAELSRNFSKIIRIYYAIFNIFLINNYIYYVILLTMAYFCYTKTNIGVITIISHSGNSVSKINISKKNIIPDLGSKYQLNNTLPIFKKLILQINEYLNGERKNFDILYDIIEVTPFQKKVLQSLTKIEYSTTTNYSSLASLINHPKAFRAVGSAIAKNPLLLLIPCHRVIKSNGETGNYAAGEEIKNWLINMESNNQITT